MTTVINAYPFLRGTWSRVLPVQQILPSVIWGCLSQIEKQLQVISVLQWIVSFCAMGPACIATLIYLLCMDSWFIPACYLAWQIYDWQTHNQGGRRASWVRNWTIWTYFRDYFPIRLIKTHHLPPSRNYIIGYHPHGIFGFGAFCNFATEANGVSKTFPGIRPFVATLAGNFWMPIVRDYLMSFGICPVARNTINYILSQNGTGNAVVIVVGGAAESLSCAPGVHSITLKNRKGFVKMALRNGADLVPVYSFGENEVYKQLLFEEGSCFRLLQRKIQKLLGFAPCLFHGRGLFSADTWGLMPFTKPITSVVGEPIAVPKIEEPSQKEVDHYHEKYIESLMKLFNKYKTRFGLKESDILVIQ